MTAQKVGSVARAAKKSETKQEKPAQITVKNGETIRSLAKKYRMNAEEFKDWTGLKTASVKAGQKINLPNDTVPEGRGIYALISKYGMTFEEFGRLNNLPKPYNKYSAAKGERFYVRNHTAGQPAKTVQKKTQTKAVKTQKSAAKTPSAAARQKLPVKTTPTEVNKAKWGSSYTPQELASKIYEGSKAWGAVGKPDFDALINEINPKNASAVLKEYTKKESLVDTLISEVSSKKADRENAVMKVYDALAMEKSYPAEERQKFAAELHKQLYDVWGMASSKNLDNMINSMIHYNAPKVQQLPKIATGNPNDKTKVTVTKKDKNTGKYITKTFTAGDLYKGAKASAKKEAAENFKLFCKANKKEYDENRLDLTPLNRIPAPTIKNGVMAMTESRLYQPTGRANGKVVILNAGHGGYSSRTGYFDCGSYSFIEKENGKYAPLLEYEKAQIYAQSTAKKLREQGYAVVITSGHSETMSDRQSMSALVSNLASGKKGGQKYDKKNIMMISLHADSNPGSKGSAVCYQPGTADDAKLQSIMTASLNSESWISCRSEQRPWNTDAHKGVGILNQTQDIPSVLLEIEYVNGCKSQNLDSYAYQKRFEAKVLDGVNKYFQSK